MMSFNPLANILTQKKLEEYKFVLSDVCPKKPSEGASEEVTKAYQKWVKADEKARCYIMASMSNVLQHQYQNMDTAYDILENLKEMFRDQTSIAKQIALREILTSKIEEGTFVRTHVLKMMSLLNDIEVLGAKFDTTTQIEMFRLNYNMNKMEFTLSNLLNELVAAKTIIKQGAAPVVLNVQRGSSSAHKKGKKKKSPKQMGYAIETAAYILNLISSKSVPLTPTKLWTKRKPSLKHVRMWGSLAYVLKEKAHKLESKLELYFFIGYPRGTKGGLFYSPKDKKVIVSTNVNYLEDDYILNHIPKSQLALCELRGENIPTRTLPTEHEPEPFLVEALPHHSGRNVSGFKDQ
ncbi:hypothetical protein MANES_01G044150v8 [Manihot esculenta]|uniref:Uncharacterized protein n=1 Tax=Manihot esculenta TaxID=3983 RepID=A0ACB7IC90_MANES|nr:hypothetical protein MANES_01G044150v8 [Manihot esculenta]